MVNIVFNYFLYLIVPLGIISFISWIIVSNKKVVYGSISAMLLFLIIFSFLIRMGNENGLAWLGYLFSYPGALIGTITGSIYSKKYTKDKDIFLTLLIFTFLGMFINFLILLLIIIGS